MATVDITMFFILLSLFFRFFDCYHNAMMLRVVAVGVVLVVDVMLFLLRMFRNGKCWVSFLLPQLQN